MRYYHRVRGRLLVSKEDSYSFIPYLLLLTLHISFPLFIEEFYLSTIWNDTLRIFVIVYSIFLPQKFQNLLWVCALFTLAILFVLLGQPAPYQHFLYPYKQISMILFFLTLLIVFFREILFSDINMRMIYQTIACYILIGLLFAIGFRLIHSLSPRAFNFPISEDFNHIYLSYIVFTSVGMGDILPSSSAAKAAVMLEAVVGQVYIAFFVSMMVGKYMGGSIRNTSDVR